jgi:hypothetical protein
VRVHAIVSVLALGACGLYGSSSDSSTGPSSSVGSFADATSFSSRDTTGEPLDVVADEGGVFVLTGDGRIVGFDRGATSARVVVAGLELPERIALDGSQVYFTSGNSSGGHSFVSSASRSAAPDAAAPTRLYDTGSGAQAFPALAVQGATVAWASKNDGAGSLFRGDVQGAKPSKVATNQGVVDAVALDGAFLYWCDGKALLRKSSAEPDEAPPATFAVAGRCSGVTAAPGAVFFSSDDGTIRAADGSPQGKVLADGLVSPAALAVDDRDLYVAAEGEHAVYAVPRGGGGKAVLARGVGPFRLAATSTDLWIADRGGGTLLRVAKR